VFLAVAVAVARRHLRRAQFRVDLGAVHARIDDQHVRAHVVEAHVADHDISGRELRHFRIHAERGDLGGSRVAAAVSLFALVDARGDLPRRWRVP
jgi:hypothetical protein